MIKNHRAIYSCPICGELFCRPQHLGTHLLAEVEREPHPENAPLPALQLELGSELGGLTFMADGLVLHNELAKLRRSWRAERGFPLPVIQPVWSPLPSERRGLEAHEWRLRFRRWILCRGELSGELLRDIYKPAPCALNAPTGHLCYQVERDLAPFAWRLLTRQAWRRCLAELRQSDPDLWRRARRALAAHSEELYSLAVSLLRQHDSLRNLPAVLETLCERVESENSWPSQASVDPQILEAMLLP